MLVTLTVVEPTVDAVLLLELSLPSSIESQIDVTININDIRTSD